MPFMSFEEFCKQAEIDFESSVKDGFSLRKLTTEELRHNYVLASTNHYSSQEEDDMIDHIYN